MARKVLYSLSLLAAVHLLDAAKLPQFIPTCKKDAADFDQCVLNAVETIRPFLTKGIARLRIPPLEPLVIPLLEVNRNTEAIQVKAKIKDVRAFGGSGFVVNRLKVDPDKLSVDASITIPQLKVTADYDVDGRALVVNLKNKGIFQGNFTNAKADIIANGFLAKNKKGVEFLEVKDLKLKVKVEDQKFNFINKGGKNDEAVTRSAMEFYKQNQKQVEELVMPIVEETATAFVRQFANAILQTIPWQEIKEHI